MQKNELISLVEEMHKNLLIAIDEQEDATIDHIANFLTESATRIRNIKEDETRDTKFAEALFHNVYKDIAKESLSSYANTNENIKKLTQMHEDTIQECSEQHINLDSLTSKFNEIQTHMHDEVQKANDIISQLNNQVKQLEAKSTVDYLTKVYNRRALSTYLDTLCTTKNSLNDFHLLILDIDNFKQLNDTHGHVAGDKVLIFIANLLKRTLRDGDKIFRYGGEEFIIILNRIDDALCKKVTQRLLELIRSNKLIYKGTNLTVTMSVGTTKHYANDTADSLISRADKALYRAKENGKNQMCSEKIDGI